MPEDGVEKARTEAILECGESLLNDYHPRIQRIGHAIEDLSTGSMAELEFLFPELWAAVTDLVEFYDYGSEPTNESMTAEADAEALSNKGAS